MADDTMGDRPECPFCRSRITDEDGLHECATPECHDARCSCGGAMSSAVERYPHRSGGVRAVETVRCPTCGRRWTRDMTAREEKAGQGDTRWTAGRGRVTPAQLRVLHALGIAHLRDGIASIPSIAREAGIPWTRCRSVLLSLSVMGLVLYDGGGVYRPGEVS